MRQPTDNLPRATGRRATDRAHPLSWSAAALLSLVLAGCPQGGFTFPETDTATGGGSSTDVLTTGTTGCGDGVCDPDEDPQGCAQDCAEPECGDGLVAPGETCDDGADNGDEYAPVGRCNARCDGFAPHCGDDVCQAGEEDPTKCPLDCTAAVCGNGVTEPGEQCDAGVDGTPADSAECDDDCTTPMCGDGHANGAAGEACDDGDDDDDDACVDGCTQAVCGDGFVHDGVEACDDANDVETDECDSACSVVEHRRVFVSGTAYKGDLGGLAGADALCQKLGGASNYRAWLSNTKVGPADRFDTTFTGFYELSNGEVVAHGWADLVDGQLEHAIDQTETGSTVPASPVWSNTGPDGAPLGAFHCTGWTSSINVELGSYGLSDEIASMWSETGDDRSCASLSRLYCFEDL